MLAFYCQNKTTGITTGELVKELPEELLLVRIGFFLPKNHHLSLSTSGFSVVIG
jgi:hypothetical protein